MTTAACLLVISVCGSLGLMLVYPFLAVEEPEERIDASSEATE